MKHLTIGLGLVSALAFSTAINASPTTQVNQQNSTTQKWSVSSNKNLGKLSLGADRSTLPVTDNMNKPFELLSATTFELGLLKMKNDFANKSVTIGGYLEADPQLWNVDKDIVGNNATKSEGSGTFATTAKLDFMANVNDWTSAFVSISGNNMATSSSTISIAKAFVTFGNLQKSPLYLTAGRVYVPFGAFTGNGPWSASLTRSEFRPDETNQVILGFYKQGLNSSISVFNNEKGDSIGDFAYNLNYTGKSGNIGYKIGGGYLYDIRNLSNSFGQAFSGSTPILKDSDKIGVYNVNGQISFKQFALAGEFFKATANSIVGTPKAGTMVTANQNLGTASSWYVALGYTPQILGKATQFMVSYSETANMEGIPVGMTQNPTAGYTSDNGVKNSWIASVQREVLSGMYIGAELQTIETYDNRRGTTETLDLSLYF